MDEESAAGTGEAASTWRALLDAQVRLEEQRSSLRRSAIGGFLAVVVASVVLRRFVFLTMPERWLLVASPSAVVAAAGVLDHFVLGRRLRRLADLAGEIETDVEGSTLVHVHRQAVEAPKDGLALLAFYSIPAALALGLAAWGMT